MKTSILLGTLFLLISSCKSLSTKRDWHSTEKIPLQAYELAAIQYPLSQSILLFKEGESHAGKELARKAIGKSYGCLLRNYDGEGRYSRILRSHTKKMLLEVPAKEDPEGKHLYNFWGQEANSSHGNNLDCIYEALVYLSFPEGPKTRKVLGKRKATEGRVLKWKYNFYKKVKFKLINARNKAAIKKKQMQQAEIEAAWARVEAKAKGLQAQTSNMLSAARTRQQNVKNYNEAAQTARKHGYKVVQKGKNMSRKAQGINDYKGLSKASSRRTLSSDERSLLSYAREARLTQNDISIFMSGPNYYMDYDYEVTMVEYTGKTGHTYAINFSDRSRNILYEPLAKKQKKVVNAKWTDELKGLSSQGSGKLETKSFLKLFWDEVKGNVIARRKEKLKEFENIYRTSTNLEEAREAGLAVILHSGKNLIKDARFTQVFTGEFSKYSPKKLTELVVKITNSPATNKARGNWTDMRFLRYLYHYENKDEWGDKRHDAREKAIIEGLNNNIWKNKKGSI